MPRLYNPYESPGLPIVVVQKGNTIRLYIANPFGASHESGHILSIGANGKLVLFAVNEDLAKSAGIQLAKNGEIVLG